MKKWTFSLALVFSLSTAGTPLEKMIDHDHHKVPSRFIPGETDYVSPLSVEGGYLRVKGEEIKGFSDEALKKLNEAMRLLELAVNSQEFKDRVLNFKNTLGEPQFASNKGLTNQQIFEIFMEGRETLQHNTPGEMNFFLKLYHRPWSRVIGYTSGNTNVIHINWRFFRKYRPYDVAANLAHEWTHKMGFDHKSAKEHDSAPYAIGYIVGDIAQRIYLGGKLH
jgi:hypothetical protein